MKYSGRSVTHIKYGSGVVAGVKDGAITVKFGDEVKKFLFPQALSHFLTFNDDELQGGVDAMLGRINKEEKRRKRERTEKWERRRRLRTMRITPKSQAAFGMVENTAEDVFDSWSACAGRYLSGESRGEPRKPSRLRANSMCLLTRLDEGAPEAERRIIGAFMAREDFDGAYCTDGVVCAHDKYRLRLPDESCLMFWDYFDAESTTKPWGKVEIRYFSNTTGKKILRDIAGALAGTELEEAAGSFLDYFCAINRI
ncbi:MAG: hypothetical protein ACOX81_00200 [Candidatus Heteroscillospira sp.]|jgi:hypothetical protein